MPPGMMKSMVETGDSAYLFALRVVNFLLPNFSTYSDTDYIVNGFNVPAGLLLQHLLSAAAYLLVVCLIGYLFLKTREVAR